MNMGINKWIDGGIDRSVMDKCTGSWLDGRLHACMNDWVMNELMMHEWIVEFIGEEIYTCIHT